MWGPGMELAWWPVISCAEPSLCSTDLRFFAQLLSVPALWKMLSVNHIRHRTRLRKHVVSAGQRQRNLTQTSPARDSGSFIRRGRVFCRPQDAGLGPALCEARNSTEVREQRSAGSPVSCVLYSLSVFPGSSPGFCDPFYFFPGSETQMLPWTLGLLFHGCCAVALSLSVQLEVAS